MSEPLVLTQIEGDIATLRLNDPDRLNALSSEMATELHEALSRAERSARAVVLCGAGRGFCAGANLQNLNDRIQKPDFDAGSLLEARINPLMLAIRDLKVPLISAVRGVAAGVGASIALSADIIVAGQGAYFLQAFRRIGLVPDGGSTFLLTRAVGRVRAMEMMLLAEKLPAPKALEWGLITRVTADDAVEAEAQRLAAELAAGPTVAIGLIRKLAWSATESDFGEALVAERKAQLHTGRTEDFREGVNAFLGKRTAKFRGA
ncbi:MAG: enoyl-CoA hydratase/isomerase family protein [Nevskia sp.]|nr:enoyl-CoA hydratase/isomerase family protein [Nevskia sp.]